MKIANLNVGDMVVTLLYANSKEYNTQIETR